MKRVVSLYLPTWPTDRVRRRLARDAPSPDQPLVLVGRESRRRVVTAADRAAQSIGIRVGMTATQAQALVPDLHILDADLSGDADALERLALWAVRLYSPVVASDPPSGLCIDATGAAHRYGGEADMLADMCRRLSSGGVGVRAAMAPTFGAAWGVARYWQSDRSGALIVDDSGHVAALSRLPIAALRLPSDMVTALRALGFDRIEELNATPRAPLALRFGSDVGRRLDQAYGRVAEPITPVEPVDLIAIRRAFAEPISAFETIERYTGLISADFCKALEVRGVGALRVDLIFYRVDNQVVWIRVGMAKALRDPKRLTRLLTDKLDTVDPGFGIESMVMRAVLAESLPRHQIMNSLGETPEADVSDLVDTLINRFGPDRLYQVSAAESDLPERSVVHVAPLAEAASRTDIPPVSWKPEWPRPARLLPHPELIETVALLPDHPPVSFTWRGIRRRVRRADGPERVFGEWWKHDAELTSVRDYFQVEDDAGERFWLFRAGDGETQDSGSQRWFLHGIFA